MGRIPLGVFLFLFLLGGACTRAWDRTGIPSREIREWKQYAFIPEEARIWYTHGFSAHEAFRWREILPLPSEILGPDTTLEHQIRILRLWKDSGIPPEQIIPWMTSGLPPEEAGSWYAEGFYAEEVDRWRVLGFSAQEAALWREEFTPQEAQNWASAGFSPEEAMLWIAVFEESPAAFHPDSFPVYARELRSRGLSPEEAGRWLQALVDRENPAPREVITSVTRWKEAGFTPAEARCLLSVISPEDALELCPSRISWEETGTDLNLARIFLPGTRDDPSPLVDHVGACMLDVMARWEYTLGDQAGLVTLSTRGGRLWGYMVEVLNLDESVFTRWMFNPSFDKLLRNPRTAYLELCGPPEMFLRELRERKGLWFRGPVKIAGVKTFEDRNHRRYFIPHLIPLSCLSSDQE